jgi:hypothetical protein
LDDSYTRYTHLAAVLKAQALKAADSLHIPSEGEGKQIAHWAVEGEAEDMTKHHHSWKDTTSIVDEAAVVAAASRVA